MIEKQPGLAGEVLVTLRLAPEVTGETAHVVGEFNDWSTTANPMRRDETSFVATISVPSGATYRFRYLINGVRWENDWQADMYAPNEFGGDDSVLDLTGPLPAASAVDLSSTRPDLTCEWCGESATPRALVYLDGDNAADRSFHPGCLARETRRETSPLS